MASLKVFSAGEDSDPNRHVEATEMESVNRLLLLR
jgi:hypothetical protein